MKRSMKNSKGKVEMYLTQAMEYSVSDIVNDASILCGQTKHTASTESYFADTSYFPLNNSDVITLDAEGRAINILPLLESKGTNRKRWLCSTSLCKTKDAHIFHDLKTLFQELLNCSLRNLDKFLKKIRTCSNATSHNEKVGHPHTCYTSYTTCDSKFLALQVLSPHFPRIRYVKRLMYDLMHVNNKLYTLDKALNNTDIDTLQNISVEARESAEAVHEKLTEINLNEDDIISQYPLAFRAFTAWSIETPKFPCISCERLCFQRDVRFIKITKNIYTSQVWSDLLAKATYKLNETNYICTYCHNNVRAKKIPPRCILNNLDVRLVPQEIENLNDYERILIQRAKAFQTVQRMGTIAKKNMPHRDMIPKVKGRTFHLPLPTEETLKKICSPTEPINLHHELYILVRGIPTKSKIVWEKLVDVKKVWKALIWLKENNHLYSEIVLPASQNKLLPSEMRDVEFLEDYELQSDDELFERIDSKPNVNCKKIDKEHTALLTQISQSDSYYEQFTIYPMYDKRHNESATTLYQMIKIHDIPLDNRTKDLDVKCFPDLYPYGVNGQHQDRFVRLTNFEFIKSRLMSKHSQFRLNIQYIFYLLNDNNMRQLNAGIFHKMNVTNPKEKYTAGTYLQKLSKQQLESNLSTIFSRLRNTPQFWKIPRMSLKCMIRNYGPATWFLTLSPAEWLWTDMLEYLREINGVKAKKMSPNELIASDPVSVSRFIQNKLEAMIRFIRSPDNPIGEVTHYFVRREYQGRGTQHFHMLIWIKGAPIIGESSAEDVSKFILKYITCRMPSGHVSPQLYQRVTTHQRHKHNSYCLRNKKTKKGYNHVCRFGFSRPITDTLKLRDVAVSVARRKQLKTRNRLYDLPRSQDEANINDYNPAILTVWEGNMDIQFVGEKSSILTWYTTKYVSKAEKSYTVDTFDVIHSTKSLCSCLWNIGMRMLNNRECGALEAADSLLGFPLYFTDPDTTIKWLDVNIIRSRKLKPKKQIEELHEESTDIFYPSIIDTYYPDRPVELESTSLYDFAKWYDIVKKKPSNVKTTEYYTIGKSLFLKKRKRGCLINHYEYNVHDQPECYYFALLLLFKPWRNINELRNKCDTYAEAFLSLQSELTHALRYHERSRDMQLALDRVKEHIDKEMAERAKNSQESCDEHPAECIPLEAEGAMKDFQDIANKIDEVDVSQMISQLNIDQKRVFDNVISTLSSENDILRLYVSGEGGTGKSFLIKTIKCWTKQIINKNTAVAAPTGIAAFNIDGLTTHRLFQLPVEHGHTAKYTQLSDTVLQIIRDQLKDVTLIIIDEVSMISNVILMYIHLRLCEIFDTADIDDGWFGKKHILLFGDLLQLPPVHEGPPFLILANNIIEKYIGAIGSINLWSLFDYDELIINMRQRDDDAYRHILSRIRVGLVTNSDTEMLQSRQLKFRSENASDRICELCNYMSELPFDTVCLLSTCAQCDTLNDAMLSRISSEEIQLIAHDSTDCPAYLKKKVLKVLTVDDNENSTRTAGLSRVITVKIGARIMIRRNIDATLGLVNGTVATIKSVVRSVDNSNDVDKITIVLSTGMEYNMERSNVKFEIMDRAFVIRKQFPISLSYGITIHKSQGLSLRNVVVDAGNSIFCYGQIYVALSRVTTLEGLHLINYDPSSVKANESAVVEYNRLREKYRPDISSIKISKQRVRKIHDVIWAISTKFQTSAEISNANDFSIHVRGLPNTDNISCYVNASIQCILHSPTIKQKLLQLERNCVMRAVLEMYNLPDMVVNLNSLRQFAGEKYKDNIQQDCYEFLIDLCSKFDVLQTAIGHYTQKTLRCTKCDYTNVSVSHNYIMSLKFQTGSKKTYDVQELLESNVSNWTEVKGLCTSCGNMSMRQKIHITTTCPVLLLRIPLFTTVDGSVRKTHNLNIKSVPNIKLEIDNKVYKCNSAIFHHGDDIIQGHYTSMLRNKSMSWIKVDDAIVEKSNWPRNAKNAYIFFFEKY